jgi:hypothetical protein
MGERRKRRRREDESKENKVIDLMIRDFLYYNTIDCKVCEWAHQISETNVH